MRESATLMTGLRRIPAVWVGIGILALQIALFQVLLWHMVRGQLDDFNNFVLLTLHKSSCPALDTIAIALTEIGGVFGTTFIAVVILGVLLKKGHRREAVVLTLLLLGGTAFIVEIKDFFQHARPDLFPSPHAEKGYSFPSGHSLMAVCLYGSMALALLKAFPHRRAAYAGAVACCLFALSIVWCRLYLGVHWPTDVMGGMLLGSMWVVVGAVALHETS